MKTLERRSDPDVADADLEARIISAYHSYVAAPRDRQGAMWAKVALLVGMRSERQVERMERRLGLV